jgi:hypothetical protein
MGADRSTYGPPSASGVNSFDQKALVLDQTNGVLYISGSANGRKLMAAMGAPLVLPPQTALTAITTVQTLLSFIFGAGALNVTGRKLRVKGVLIYSTTAANVATISFALTLGGVTLCTITTAATNTAASANLPIQFEFELTVVTLGATATIESHGRVDANIGTVAAADAATYLDTNIAVSAAVNLTAAATLGVTIAASAAIPSAQLRSATLMYEA